MPYYGVANGRQVGVYDNWEDCKDQVNGYSYNKYKKFDTPAEAWDFVDENSSRSNAKQSFNSKAVACRNDNQVALRGDYQGEATNYHRTDRMQGRNGVIVRERSYKSGRDGNGYFVENYTRTYWKNY
ncbi:ribonuclease H isoform X2 [Monomorium pharaonis]|nr:ribonuclease H isoform X2 [Monomorium pharaonis]XP_036143555.1 ribonuclease H isoform X2 [Monomorium pharaonis]